MSYPNPNPNPKPKPNPNPIMPGKPDGLNIMLSKQKGICNFRLRPSVEENLQTCAR